MTKKRRTYKHRSLRGLEDAGSLGDIGKIRRRKTYRRKRRIGEVGEVGEVGEIGRYRRRRHVGETGEIGRYRRRHHSSGLGAIADSFKGAAIMNVLKKVAGMYIGYTVARNAEKMVFKGGATDAKKWISPILAAGGGIILANNKNEIVAGIGIGLVTGGVVDGINKVMGKDKDITNLSTLGLKGLNLGSLFSTGRIGKSPIQIELPEYKPSLPELTESTDGYPENDVEILSNTEDINAQIL